MVRWVASSGYVADDNGSGLEVEMPQNLYLSQLCVFLCVLCFVRVIVGWLLKSGTERNGTVPPTKIRNAWNGTVTEQSGLVHGSLAPMALIMACSLSITRGYFALRMAGMSCTIASIIYACTHRLKSSLCVRKLAFMDQEHCRDDTH